MSIHYVPTEDEELSTTTVSVAAPARVNLIGEHTDYTGGFVLPMAIPFETVVSISLSSDGAYHFATTMFASVRSFSPEDRSARTGEWSDYPVGVLRQLQQLDIRIPPFRLDVRGNVPLGAGLSSSASIEVATAVALLSYARKTLSVEEIAVLCRRAENEYVASPCGIMDQFIITAAKAGHALLLNTRTCAYELLPTNRKTLSSCLVVVANSGIRHSIAGGDYGVRRQEVEAGQAAVLARFPRLRDLGDVSLDELAVCEHAMTDESYRRCRHIISENARVLRAKDAMLEGDPVRLGKLMSEAHISERDDFECSIKEIDFLVETASSLEGCYGARLTGGGFGGCTVNLVDASKVENFTHDLKKAYRAQFSIETETYICDAVDGAIARNPGVAQHPDKDRM